MDNNHGGSVNLMPGSKYLYWRLGSGDTNTRDLTPGCQGGCSQFAMVGGGNVVARNLKEIGDRVVDRNESLNLSS